MNNQHSDVIDSPSWTSCFAVSAAYQGIIGTLLLCSISAHSGLSWDTLRAILVNWDARHYLFIAEYGYPSFGKDSVVIVFFPLYPWLIQFLTLTCTGSYLFSGVTITALCSIAAHAIFIRYAITITGSRERGVRAALLFFLSPISIACTLIYTEALYLLGVSLLLWGTLHKKYGMMTFASVIAMMSRLVGVLACIPFYGLLLTERPTRPRTVILSSAVMAFAVAVYPLLNVLVHNNPFHFLQVQKEHWHKSSVNPFMQWWHHTNQLLFGTLPKEPWIAFDAVLTVSILPILLVSFVRLLRGKTVLPWYWLAWTAGSWYVVASQSFWLSNSRYLLACLPLYIIMEELLPRNRGMFFIVLLVMSGITAAAFLQAGTGGWLY